MRAEYLDAKPGDRGEYRAHFDSLAEFVEHVNTSPAAPGWGGRRQSRATDHNRRKQGTLDWSEALRLANSGWTGADERIAALSGKLTETVASLIERPAWRLDVSGDALDVGLYLSGEPECWRTLEWQISEGFGRRIFRIIVPLGGTAVVTPNDFTWAGAAAVAAVECIERAGHGAEVWGYNTGTTWGGPVLSARILLKPAEYPLDAPRLAFVCANVAFHRRLMFAFRESAPEAYSRSFVGTYGRTEYPYLTESGEPNDITLPTPIAVNEYARAGGAQEGLMRWLIANLSRHGIIRDEAAPAA